MVNCQSAATTLVGAEMPTVFPTIGSEPWEQGSAQWKRQVTSWYFYGNSFEFTNALKGPWRPPRGSRSTLWGPLFQPPLLFTYQGAHWDKWASPCPAPHPTALLDDAQRRTKPFVLSRVSSLTSIWGKKSLGNTDVSKKGISTEIRRSEYYLSLVIKNLQFWSLNFQEPILCVKYLKMPLLECWCYEMG